MVYSRRPGRLGTAPQATIQPMTVPASIGGVNALNSLMQMPPSDCIYTYNLMPSEYGMRMRKGYREWSTGCPSDVHTLIPYDHQRGDQAKDRLFAACAEGIYNITLFGTTAPVQEVAFGDNSIGAGYGVFTNFTTGADDILVLYADENNGLHQYDGDSFAWSIPAIQNVDPADIAFVTTHKQRVWMIEQGSADAWYLGVDAVAGPATKFNFGSKFKHGGRLMGLWSWTVDGGDGVDDFLVAVSRSGDVLVYYGSDPSQPDWSLRGSYFIGEIPNSRRVAVERGAELYILSTFGLVSVRDLLNGVYHADTAEGSAAKIARLLRGNVVALVEERDWQMVVHPADGFMQIITPWATVDGNPEQYVMNILTDAWGWWRGVPALCGENWLGEYFLGAPDGVVYIHDGVLDGTKLDGTIGVPIEWRTLTSFQPYGEHGQYLKAELVRTVGVVSGVVSLNIRAIYDYNIGELIKAPPSPLVSGTNVWDTGLWDVDLWDSGSVGDNVKLGAAGIGRTMAIGSRGFAEARITIIGWDVMFQQGGLV